MFSVLTVSVLTVSVFSSSTSRSRLHGGLLALRGGGGPVRRRGGELHGGLLALRGGGDDEANCMEFCKSPVIQRLKKRSAAGEAATGGPMDSAEAFGRRAHGLLARGVKAR